MADHNLTTRRALLKGLPLAAAAIALPAAGIAAEASAPLSPEDAIQHHAMELAKALRAARPGVWRFNVEHVHSTGFVLFHVVDGPASVVQDFNSYPGTVSDTATKRASTIADLFDQWRDARSDDREETEEQAQARFRRYVALQRRITAMRPASAREAAMQFVVETDDGDSDFRTSYYRRVRRLAFGA